jgi:oligopeptide/dipeptide ABC transporter ATP-binding protein
VTSFESPALRVEGLTTVFRLADGRDAPAVAGVSVTLPRGRTLGLVGESGSGKSVTALSIVRLVVPPGRIVAGHVFLEDRDLLALDEAELRSVRGRRIGFVFQEPMVALDPVYTIGAQIAETLQVHDLARGAAAARRVIELLDAVHIPDPARRSREYPHQLSGGLRQRAMLALALAADVQAEILDLLRDLRRRLSLSVLLITHDLGVVAEMADEVAVMYAGRIVEHGPVDTVFAEPLHPYTRALFSSIPGAHPGRGLTAIPGTVPALGKWPAGCAFAPRCPHRFEVCDQLPDLVAVHPEHHSRCFLHSPVGTRS